jgi:hypothetical protein
MQLPEIFFLVWLSHGSGPVLVWYIGECMVSPLEGFVKDIIINVSGFLLATSVKSICYVNTILMVCQPFYDYVVQGISFVLATDEHRRLLEPAAQKCGAHFVLLPSVASLQNSLQESKEDGRVPIEQVVADAQKISSSIRGTVITP